MKYREMTSAALRKVNHSQTVVLVPIAAVEQHGPHLPTGTDAIICEAIASAVETRLAQSVLLTPTIWLGASSHHLRFGSTLDCSLATFSQTLCEIMRSLLDDGYRRILLLNGHGGNVDPMRMALRQTQPRYPDRLLAGGSYWSLAGDLIQETLEGEHKSVGHACEFETSLMMHLRPELVRDDELADAGKLLPDQIDGLFVARDMRQRTAHGFTGRPDLASADKGQRLFDGIVDRLAATVTKLRGEPSGIGYKDFEA